MKKHTHQTTHLGKMTPASTVVGGVIGAVAGAAIGTVAVAVLQNEKTRRQIQISFKTIREEAFKALKEISKDEELRQQVKKHVTKARSEYKTNKNTD